MCGQTGCGKSTLLRLLLRLYDPQEGKILIGGVDIKTLEPAWLREHVSFVTSVKDTCVPLPFHCDVTAFACCFAAFPLQFHCLALMIHCPFRRL